MPAWLLTAFGLLLSALVEGFLKPRQAVEDATKAGAAKADADANKVSADVVGQMSEANSRPRDRDTIIGRLSDGSA